MNQNEKLPLVTVGLEDEIFRIATKAGGEGVSRVHCPIKDKPCTWKCAFFLMVSIRDHDVFKCMASQSATLLGIVDYNSISVDIIRTLEHGSNLVEHLEATTSKTARRDAR